MGFILEKKPKICYNYTNNQTKKQTMSPEIETISDTLIDTILVEGIGYEIFIM